MKQYLKRYQVVMRTLGPVFVGSGREINKREYIRLSDGRVGIPDIPKLYEEMSRRRKQAEFENYLLGHDGQQELTQWLRGQKIPLNELYPFISYWLDCGDFDWKGNRLQVKECIKDAYDRPYIPGSTLKGMLRTILLGADIRKAPEKYENLKDVMERNAGKGESRTVYLKKDINGIENKCYRILELDKEHPDDAVNDILRGVVVSDSAPLSTDRLALCQKVDLHVNGGERRIPILRECIKPGTEIQYTITVDSSVCDLTEEKILAAVKSGITCYYNRFLKAFKGVADSKPKVNYLYCGGGCGFATKTIIYPLYGQEEGIKITQEIFKKTGVCKHDSDRKNGASPHMVKCTYYQGKRYQMGLCDIRIEELPR